MPDNKKNPQQDQQRKGQEQQQDREKQGDRGQPGFNDREDRGGVQPQKQDQLKQDQMPEKEGVTQDEDFDQQETENERVSQRNPQPGADMPKTERK